MPYIEKADRAAYDDALAALPRITSQGDLNYVLTQICLRYTHDGGSVRYARINDVVGALECCKLEYYRREASPYEDNKITANGDVYR